MVGESWHLFMDGMVGTDIQDLVAVNNRLYAHDQRSDIVQSVDGGESWKACSELMLTKLIPNRVKEGQSRLNFSADSRLAIAGNTLYVIIT